MLFFLIIAVIAINRSSKIAIDHTLACLGENCRRDSGRNFYFLSLTWFGCNEDSIGKPEENEMLVITVF